MAEAAKAVLKNSLLSIIPNSSKYACGCLRIYNNLILKTKLSLPLFTIITLLCAKKIDFTESSSVAFILRIFANIGN